jgi:hypothetical protein
VLELTILAVPGCPGAVLLEQRLAEVLSDRRGVRLRRRIITSTAQVERWRMYGSPTLLVNGADPFAAPGAAPALACRLYQADGGRLDTSPSVPALRLVLGQASPPS